MANPNNGKSLMTTIVLYRTCQNHNNCIDFTVDHADLLMCNTCGCHRDDHHREESTTVIHPSRVHLLRHFIANAPPQLNPRFEPEDGVVIQVPQVLQPMRAEGRGISLAQMQQMRELAEEIGWNIQAFDGRDFRADLERIGVTARVFKTWMRHNQL